MSSIYQRGKTWTLQWVDSTGKTRQRSLKTKDHRAAIELQKQHDAMATLYRLRPEERPAAISTAIAGWWRDKETTVGPATLHRYRSSVLAWERFLDAEGITDARHVTREVVTRFIAARRAEGVGEKTCHEDVTIWRQLVEWMLERGDLAACPVSSWPRLKRRPVEADTLGAYSSDEVRILLDHFIGRPQHKPLIFLAFTGCRVDEMWRVRWSHVDLVGRAVRLKTVKSVRSAGDLWRTVELHPRLLEMLTEMSAAPHGPADLVFGERHKYDWFLEPLKTACRRLKIQYRKAHGFRHAWITHLLEAGAPLAVVSQMAGHRHLSTTQRYLHIQDGARGWVDRL